MTAREALYSRVALGTAQFGLDYGITNRNGALPEACIADIFERALPLGIRLLDTAPAYGNSESIIGTLDSAGAFDIITKVPPPAAEMTGAGKADALERQFEISLGRLGRTSIEGLLVHHGKEVLSPDGDLLIQRMERMRADGRVWKIGVSVYSAAEIDGILTRFTPDIIQVPISVADQRLIASGHIEKLKSAGIEIHARSLFLQGTLLTPPCALPDFFRADREAFRSVATRASEMGLSSLEICLAFAVQNPALDRLILGISSVAEFQEIIAAVDAVADVTCEVNDLAFPTHAILDPSGWPSV